MLRRTPIGPLGVAGGPVLLEIDIARGVQEAPAASPVEVVRARHTPILRTLVEHLRKATTDTDVAGLIAGIGPGALTVSQSEELRSAVQDFRAAGKVAIAWSPSFGEMSAGTTGYHLATAFDEIWLQPSGGLGLVGYHAEAPFARGALERLGVEPQMSRRHEYKSATEIFDRHEMSEPNAEMTQRLLDSITESVVADIAGGRGIEEAAVRSAIDAGPLTADEALARNLIDHIGYRDGAYAAAQERIGAAEPTLRFVERHGSNRIESLVGDVVRMPVGVGGKQVIGVIQASGPILLGRGGSGLSAGPVVASEQLGAALRSAGRDDNVRAVVLRIDSPGGSNVASDAIRREIQLVRRRKPVIASMASVAASGGYYLAMPCTAIVANATTITGSIGVLAGKQVLRGGLERIGINRATLASGPYAAMFSSNQGFSEAEWALLDRWLDEVYAGFTAKAAADRSLPVEDLRAVARGRVWSGADAAERGLVDQLGGFEAALAEACRRSGVGVEDVSVRAIPKPSPLQLLKPMDSTDAVEATAGFGGGHEGILGGVAEGPAVWRALLASVREIVGLPYAGVLSLPPIRIADVLP